MAIKSDRFSYFLATLYDAMRSILARKVRRFSTRVKVEEGKEPWEDETQDRDNIYRKQCVGMEMADLYD